MVTVEVVVCGAVELYQRGLEFLSLRSFIKIGWTKQIETPVSNKF